MRQLLHTSCNIIYKFHSTQHEIFSPTHVASSYSYIAYIKSEGLKVYRYSLRRGHEGPNCCADPKIYSKRDLVSRSIVIMEKKMETTTHYLGFGVHGEFCRWQHVSALGRKHWPRWLKLHAERLRLRHAH